MSYKGLTLEQHKELSELLRHMSNESVQVLKLLQGGNRGNGAGYTLKFQDKWSCRILDAIMGLRSAMDDRCCAEHPAEFSPGIYYPQGWAKP